MSNQRKCYLVLKQVQYYWERDFFLLAVGCNNTGIFIIIQQVPRFNFLIQQIIKQAKKQSVDRDLVSLSSKTTQQHKTLSNSLPTKSEFIANTVLVPQVNFVKINFLKSQESFVNYQETVSKFILWKMSECFWQLCAFLHFFLLYISVVGIYLLS